MFKLKIKEFVCIFSSAILSSVALADDIRQSCMVSFNVKDRVFDSGSATMSCKLLEVRRGKLFSAIEALPASGALSGEVIAAQLKKIEQDLRQLEGQTKWTELSIS